MSIEQLFNQARAAIRNGQRDEALKLLVAVVREDPDYAPAWLWMSEVLDEPDRRRECLERVLMLDPNNAVAKQGILLLDMQSMANQAPLAPPPEKSGAANKRLGDYLVENHFITQTQLDVALKEQAQEARYGRSTPLGDILLKRRWLTVQGLTRVLDMQKEARAKEGIVSLARLGDYLVQSGLVTQTQLDQVVARQADLKRRGQNFQIGELLVLSGMVSRQQIDKAIEEQKQGYHNTLNQQ